MSSVSCASSGDVSARAFWWSVAACTAVGAGLRFANLSGRDFWFDESCTFIYVHNLFNWPAGSNLLAESTNLPYYVLLRGWTRIFGESEAAFRSLSAVASTLTIPLLALTGARVGGRRVGVLCAILASLHPLAVYYAQEARAYALWMLMLTACTLALIEAVRRQRAGWWAAFGALLLFTLHLHYFTVFWGVASVSAVLLGVERWRGLRTWAITLCAVAIGFAPYVFLAVVPAAGSGGSAWIAPSFEPATAIPATLWALLPAGAYPAHLRGLSVESPDTTVRQATALVVASQVIPALIIAGTALRLMIKPTFEDAATSAESADRRAWGLSRLFATLAGLTLGPLILALGYSLAVRPIYLVGRYDLVAWPGAMMLMSLLLAAVASNGGFFRARRLVAVVTALLAFGLVPLHRLMAFDPPVSWHRARAERLSDLAQSGDLVIAFSYDRDYLAYYLHRAGFRGETRSFPTWLERQVGWVDTAADTSPERLRAAEKDAVELMMRVEQVLRAGGRALVLSDSVDPQGQSPRAELHHQLFLAAQAIGLGVQPLAPELGIYEFRQGAAIGSAARLVSQIVNAQAGGERNHEALENAEDAIAHAVIVQVAHFLEIGGGGIAEMVFVGEALNQRQVAIDAGLFQGTAQELIDIDANLGDLRIDGVDAGAVIGQKADFDLRWAGGHCDLKPTA